MASNSRPVSICRRLINFILSKFISRPRPSDSDEITVEFRHTDGSENRTQIDERPTVRNGLEEKQKQEDGSVTSDQKSGAVAQAKGIQEGKHPRKSVTIKESVGEDEKEKAKKEEANQVKDQPREDTKPKPPRHWGPLLSVASNINEKTEAFISSRKRAMRRNYSLDPERS
ncbi:uncharacterized protein LOC110012187 [Sesamum indicum]|uniref:Uncharacterized protein LOC110012187 n=1 Tax=Sesamum indicum TaxID=4182 RepID=A0A8M8V3R7_SESIN|nr:uncharacterized protein LOC110012187 [Sesamum indicum]